MDEIYKTSLTRYVFLICIVILTGSVLVYVSQDHHVVCPRVELPPAIPPTVQVIVNVASENRTSEQTQAETSDKWDYNWDFKAWKDPSEANGVATRTIILIRHGQYDLNTGLLNDNGHKQANYTGQRLQEFNVEFDKIIHSNLDRAKTTANLVHNYLPNVAMMEDDILAEGGPIQPKPTISYWSLPDRNYFVDGPRLEAAFRKYFYRADKTQTTRTRDILVGHGNIFRYFILRALQMPRSAWMRIYLPHASISRIYINPDGTVTCDMFGDAGHMPHSMVTL